MFTYFLLKIILKFLLIKFLTLHHNIFLNIYKKIITNFFLSTLCISVSQDCNETRSVFDFYEFILYVFSVI